MKLPRLRPGELRPLRIVRHLYPAVPVTLTPADVEYYRNLGPYAIVLDRQSQQAQLTSDEATGQANRVRNVLQLARELQLAVPEPPRNEDHQEGEFHFDFASGACPRHWFVDGLVSDASGFTASPYARLQLWRAAKIARALRDYGCPPRAVLIGELTRFFRDQKQFLDWYHILKGVCPVRIFGCPDLTPETEEMLLPMYLCQVAALSRWLRTQRQMARATRRERGELFNITPPFGLKFDWTTRKHVYPDLLEWPILQQLVRRAARDEFATQGEAMVWFVAACETAGIEPRRVPHSRAWLALLLRSDLLTGRYRQYVLHDTPCRVEDGEMRADWDHTPKGHRRYYRIRDMDGALEFPILLTPEQRIDPHDLTRARQTLTRRGRPAAPPPDPAGKTRARALTLFRYGVIRCRHCGSPIDERNPQQEPSTGRQVWTRTLDEELLHLRHHEGLRNREIAARMEMPLWRIEVRKSQRKYQSATYAADYERLVAFWEEPFARRHGVWHLYCDCVQDIMVDHAQSQAQARAEPLAQHRRKRNGSLSLALEPLLWAALREDPAVSFTDSLPRPTVDLAALEAEEARVVRAIQKLQRDYEEENWVFYTEAQAELRMGELRQQHAGLAAEIAGAKGSAMLDANDRQEALDWEQTRQELLTMVDNPHFRHSIRYRRRFCELVVKQVIVDLETGQFEAETRFAAEPLRRLHGEVGCAGGNGEEQSPSGPAWSFAKQFRITGSLRAA